MYAVLWDDRHCDTTVHLFSDKNVAIEWAKKIAKEYCRFEEDYTEITFDSDGSGWVFSVDYSCEGDSLTVTECEIDKDYNGK